MNEEEIIKDINTIKPKNFNNYKDETNCALITKKQVKAILGLLDLYQQEKEKNKKLEEHQKQYLDGELITAKQGKFFEKMIKENYIRKDKIKEIYNILGEYRHFSTPTNEQIEQNENAVDKAVNFIKELLEMN